MEKDTLKESQVAITLNNESIAKLDSQLKKHTPTRTALIQQSQPVAEASIHPAMSAALAEQKAVLLQKIEQLRGGVQTRDRSPKSSSSPAEQLKQAINTAKQALKRSEKAFGRLNIPPKAVDALIDGGHIPAEKLHAARQKMAQIDQSHNKATTKAIRPKKGHTLPVTLRRFNRQMAEPYTKPKMASC